MIMKATLIIGFFLCSCKLSTPRDQDIVVVISVANNLTIDLSTDTYTIYFLSKPPLLVKFSLTSEDKERIRKTYFSLHLNEMARLVMPGGCKRDPQILTTITVKSQLIDQTVKIDESCAQPKDDVDAQKVLFFLNTIDSVLQVK